MMKNKNKGIVFASLLITFLISSISAVPSSAQSPRNGVNCSKFGAVTKVGAKSYRCAKNPFVKPTKNTWTLRGCLTAYAMWKDAKEQYADWIDLAKLAGAEGQKTMDELQSSIIELEATMKDVVCKRGA